MGAFEFRILEEFKSFSPAMGGGKAKPRKACRYVAQPRLAEEEKRKIAEWIKSIPEDRDKAIALFFKWS